MVDAPGCEEDQFMDVGWLFPTVVSGWALLSPAEFGGTSPPEGRPRLIGRGQPSRGPPGAEARVGASVEF